MAVPDVPGALLLCVDMQAPFLGAIPDREALTRRCRFAVAAARGVGLRVAFTEQVPQKLGPTVRELLGLVDHPVQFAKSTFSALADDGIRETIRGLDIEHMLLCGIETPVCIYQTAIDGLNANLQVTVLSDAVGGRRAQDGVDALAALARAGVHVLPSETVFYSLLHDVRHPFFRGYTELVKTHG
jgi:hypothetical protein